MAAARYKLGEFCWTDLGCKDAPAAKDFYSGLFGWTSKDYPMGDGVTYSMMRIGSKAVCAIYQMTPEMVRAKQPSAWLPYILVKSADDVAKAAKRAKGKLEVGPLDVMEYGRMAIVTDPGGAQVALWQAGTNPGADLEGKPGAMTWHDLNTPKPRAAGPFYTKVFGWKVEDQKFSRGAYHLFKLGREGICGMWPEPMKGLRPSWVTYFRVKDCAKAVAKAKRLGGRALMGTTVVPGIVRFAVLADPQGAVFGVLQPQR
ncbi:MAG: VOC family protein [Candidatus Eremiobacteraeota bacterium]|nr:VOC family protein [Candidatus Eremiobacteraeota bacterium]MBV8365533.1 VOC family protein [Candidatus Eremiobacteraeota bacterium]